MITFKYQKTGNTVNDTVYGNDLVEYTIVQQDYTQVKQSNIEALQGITEEDLTSIIEGLQGYDSRKKTASLVPATLDLAKEIVVGMLVGLKKEADTDKAPLYVFDGCVDINDQEVEVRKYNGTNDKLMGTHIVQGYVQSRTVLEQGLKEPKKVKRSLIQTVIKDAITYKFLKTPITFKLDQIVG